MPRLACLLSQLCAIDLVTLALSGLAEDCQQDVHYCMESWQKDMVEGGEAALKCLDNLFFGSTTLKISFDLHEQREPERVQWEYDQPI